MLDIHVIRENPEGVREAIRVKKFEVDLDRLIELDGRRRDLVHRSEQLRAEKNTLAGSFSKLPKEERDVAVARSKEVGAELKEMEGVLATVQVELDALMLRVPNIPAPEVPEGDSDEDNLVLRYWGEKREFDFTPKDHIALCAHLGLVDFDRPRRFAGARSYALLGDGALLEQAVLRFALDSLADDGFVAVAPPVLVREEALVGTGFFPLGYEDTYRTERGELFLVGTSEVSLVSMHAGEILEPSQLPVRYAGISPCFRREAGAAGKDTRGLYRVHQFNKVEQVVICRADPEESLRHHLHLLSNSERILQALGIPHRVALACSRELGLGQVRKHEVESWMPSRGAYSETHSCSTLHEFQARRSMIRYREEEGGKPIYAHTLNNTAIASPRILIPILENFQNADGTVTIPPALRPYMRGQERIEPR